MIKSTIIVILISAIFTSACGLSQIPILADIARSTETPTPLPTSTPIPSPTPTATPPVVSGVQIPLGDRALFEGDYSQAVKEYESAFNGTEDDDIKAAALTGIGRSYFLLGDLVQSMESFLAVINDFPESDHTATSYFFLGEVYTGLEQYSDAAKAYRQYILLRPDDLDGYIYERIGDSHRKAGLMDEALLAFEQAIIAGDNPDPLNVRVKIGNIYEEQESYEEAINQYWTVYQETWNDFVKAQMDYQIGQIYLILDESEQAFTRLQDAVVNFPKSYHAYLSLLLLLDKGEPVDDFYRGLINFHMGQYGYAINFFDRYMKFNPDHDGTGHYYKAISYRALNNINEAIAEWDLLIRNYPENSNWTIAWRDKGFTQWAYLQRYQESAQTMLDFVSRRPESPDAPKFLFDAGRILERNNNLSQAASVWERMIIEYPQDELSFRGLFLSGISYYRLQDYEKALIAFQRGLVLAPNPKEQAASYLWVGKTQRAKNEIDAAYRSWEQAALRDPTGYYSERARDLLLDRESFTVPMNYDLGYDLRLEREEAENWIRLTFFLDESVDLSGPGELLNDPRIKRGTALWELGLYQQALIEFEKVKEDVWLDPAGCYRLMHYLLELGYYRTAILLSRQVLDLANLDNLSTLNAPILFNHIRFGTYFNNLIVPTAQEYGLHPLLLFSVIRQESLFEGFISSSAGARGLMQIMPGTAGDIVSRLDWPPDFSENDLNRPVINIPLGVNYLTWQLNSFNGNMTYALAAYNAGPGNALIWANLAMGDTDLFLEIVRLDEPRNYIMQIAEFLNIYRTIYQR